MGEKIQKIADILGPWVEKMFPGLFRVYSRRRSLIKFLAVGSFTGFLDLVGLFIFHRLLNLLIVEAATLAFIVSFLITFSLHRYWTFHCQPSRRQYLLYSANIFLCLNLNALLMHVLVNRLSIWYLISQVLANGIIGLYNFLMYRFVIFKPYDTSCLQKPAASSRPIN